VSVFASDKINQAINPDAKGEAGGTGNNSPRLGNGPLGPPDPWHNLPSFLGETNPEGILQWVGLKDCSSEDTEGHGTWVASRILGAANGFASNGVAPKATVTGYKVLSTGFGGLTSWIVDAMIRACDADVDLINMSLGGYDDPFDLTNPNAAADEVDFAIWVAAVNYCRARGTAIFASAGNEHVRVDDYTVPAGSGTFHLLDGLSGVGRVDPGNEGIVSVTPGTATLSKYTEDVRGMLEALRRCSGRRDGLGDEQRDRRDGR
jgi:hypothetical protein